MEFKTIVLAKDGPVSLLALNRPEAMNALNAELIREMEQALDIVADDKQTRVLILTGSTKVFAAGGDIKAMLECDPWQAKAYVGPIHRVFNKLTDFPKPTIAAICGFTLGGGVELALACDLRIAGDNARFGFPEINLGIFPAAGGSQRLPRLIGLAKAKELMFTGDAIDAWTALQIGLVNRVVPVDEVMQEARQLADKLSAKAPIALKSLKESIHTGLNTDLVSGLTQEIEKLCLLFATLDQKEGMTAFVERRKPEFKGM